MAQSLRPGPFTPSHVRLVEPVLRVDATVSLNHGRIDDPIGSLTPLVAIAPSDPAFVRTQVLARLLHIPNIARVTGRLGLIDERQVNDDANGGSMAGGAMSDRRDWVSDQPYAEISATISTVALPFG